ncbi:MAG: hypothetical protein ACTHKL_06730, partial [Streptosporangiaceae bacterium]
MRPTKKLLILITGVVLAVVAVIAFAASAAARRSSGDHGTSATTTSHTTTASHAQSGGHEAKSLHGITAVPASIGLRPGAVSPSAAGIAAAKNVMQNLDAYQLAGQRVIYSYTGRTP